MRLLDVALIAAAAGAAAEPPERGFEGRFFEDVTVRAGVAAKHSNRAFQNPYAEIMAGYTALGAAVAVADFDGDGFEDLFVTDSAETGKNHLYRNNGDFTFTDVAAKAGVAGGNDAADATADALWLDYDNDGRPDLFVARFGHSRLFHNQGGGRFEDVTRRAGLDRYANAITAVAFDYDRDGDLDTKKGMNADWGDYDNDGWLDLYVTNITTDYMREGNFLWRNNGVDDKGKLSFSDVARETGTHDTGWGWGAKFFDYDDDGWLDLYVVNGWVSAGPESYVPDIFAMITRTPAVDFADARNWPPMGGKSLSGYEKKRLFHNEAGTFREEAARHSGSPRAAAPSSIFVDGGNGFAGQSSRRVHFGLADAAAIDRLEVRWPSGARQTFTHFPADRLYRLVEAEPDPQPFTPEVRKR
jgi:hypothetical protein